MTSPLSSAWELLHPEAHPCQYTYRHVPSGEPLESEGTRSRWDGLASFRKRATLFLTDISFQAAMAMVVLLNAIVIGLETDTPRETRYQVIENIFLMIFAVELLARIAAYGPQQFFDVRSEDFPWNVLDTTIVVTGIMDRACAVIIDALPGDSAKTVITVIRLTRLLRFFRIVRFVRKLHLLARGLFEAVKATFWITALMSIFLYLCSIVLVRTLGHVKQDDENFMFLHKRFGTVARGMFTLFELMASPNLPEYQAQEGLLMNRPAMAGFMIAFVIFGSFGMIGVLTGVINESMFEKNLLKVEEERKEKEEKVVMITEACTQMYDLLPKDDNGNVSQTSIAVLLPEVQALFEKMGICFIHDDLVAVFTHMDMDTNGEITKEEFIQSVLSVAAGLRASALQEILFTVLTTQKKITSLEKLLSSSPSVRDDVTFIKDFLVEKFAEVEASVKMVSESHFEIQRTQAEILQGMRHQGAWSTNSNASEPEAVPTNVMSELPSKLNDDSCKTTSVEMYEVASKGLVMSFAYALQTLDSLHKQMNCSELQMPSTLSRGSAYEDPASQVAGMSVSRDLGGTTMQNGRPTSNHHRHLSSAERPGSTPLAVTFLKEANKLLKQNGHEFDATIDHL